MAPGRPPRYRRAEPYGRGEPSPRPPAYYTEGAAGPSPPPTSERVTAVDTNQVTLVKNFILSFTSTLYQAMPFVVLGAIIAGILEELVPQRLVARFLPRNRYVSICLGALLGLVFPMCECGIIPVMRRLLRKGFPLSSCTAYLLAGPIINPIVILTTIAAFTNREPPESVAGRVHPMGPAMMTGLRVGLGFLVAVGTSILVEALWRRHGTKLMTPLALPRPAEAAEEDEAEALPRSAWQRLSNITSTALHDFVDIMVFLILGALLASLAAVFFTPDDIAALGTAQPLLAIAAMMGFAMLISLCSEADAFVAANFVSLVPAPKLAFLVIGPMMDVKLFLMYTRVFRPRLIWAIIVAVVVQVFLYAALTHYGWEYYASLQSAAPGP